MLLSNVNSQERYISAERQIEKSIKYHSKSKSKILK